MSRPVLLAVLLAAAACDTVAESLDAPLLDVDVSRMSHDPDNLVGVWDLRSVTSAGFGTPPRTARAADLGWSQSYAFRANGTVDIARDGVLEERTVYTVEVPPAVHVTQLRIGGEARYQRLHFGVLSDRLYIDHRLTDGSLLEYIRR